MSVAASAHTADLIPIAVGRWSRFFPALLATALPVAYVSRATDSYILPRTGIVIAGACVALALALVVGATGRLGAERWPIAAAAAAALLAFAFSINWSLSLTGSYLRYESLPVRLSYLALFASTVWLLRGQDSRAWLIGGFVFGTCVSCIEAFQQWLAHDPFRPDGNLGNANLLAALVAMALPLALYRCLRRDQYFVAWGAAVVILAGGWWLTSSRSGGVAILAGCLTLAVLATRGRLVVGAALLSLAAAAGGLLAVVASPLRALNNDPPELRMHLWSDAFQMIAARPFTGWGEDTTGLAFGRFLSRDYSGIVTFDRIHSGPLDIAAMQGLIGLAALGSVIVVLGIAGWRHRLKPDVAGLTAAVVGYSVWVLFNFDWAPVTGVFWILAGTLWVATADHELAKTEVKMTSAWRPSLAAALVVVGVVLGAFPVVADVLYLGGRTEAAVRLDPLQAQYHWGFGTIPEMQRAADLGETEPSLYIELGDEYRQAGDLTAARRTYQRAHDIDPYYSDANQRLAELTGGAGP